MFRSGWLFCPLFFVFCLFVCFGNFTFYRQHANLAGTLSGHGSWVLGVSFCPDNTHFVSRYSPFCIVIKIIHKSSLFNKRKRLSGNCVKLNKIYYKICKDLCVFNWVKEQLFSSVAFQFQWQDSKSLGCRLKAVYSDILWTQWPGNWLLIKLYLLKVLRHVWNTGELSRIECLWDSYATW